jgi:Trk K+ transport system NAD-binding subunit
VLAGLTVAQLRRFEINVLGSVRAHSKARPRMRVRAPDDRIEPGYTLLLVGEEENMENFLTSVSD